MKPAYKDRFGMTLVELVLALVLLNVVILTGLSMEFGVRRVFTSADIEAQMLGELAPIVTMITKDVSRGIGRLGDLPYSASNVGGCNPTLRVRIDSNNNAQIDGSDIWVAYGFTSNQIRYYPSAAAPATYQILSDKISGFSYTYSTATGELAFVLRAKPFPAAGTNSTNPEVVINSSAHFRATSYY